MIFSTLLEIARISFSWRGIYVSTAAIAQRALFAVNSTIQFSLEFPPHRALPSDRVRSWGSRHRILQFPA